MKRKLLVFSTLMVILFNLSSCYVHREGMHHEHHDHHEEHHDHDDHR